MQDSSAIKDASWASTGIADSLLISLVMIKCNTWRFLSVPPTYWNVVVDRISLSSSNDACATPTSKFPTFP
ncbi:hypothetical protein Tco_1197428 [Tanacetum coccineum]